MKPCRNMSPPCPAARTGTSRAAGTPAPAGAADNVNRYCHPIRVKGAARSGSTEELLSRVLETLSHQGDLLEELLRRTGGEDTR